MPERMRTFVVPEGLNASTVRVFLLPPCPSRVRTRRQGPLRLLRSALLTRAPLAAQALRRTGNEAFGGAGRLAACGHERGRLEAQRHLRPEGVRRRVLPPARRVAGGEGNPGCVNGCGRAETLELLSNLGPQALLAWSARWTTCRRSRLNACCGCPLPRVL